MNNFNEYKNFKFQEFDAQEGYKIIIDGNFKIAGVDTMNIINLDTTLIHESFIKFSFNKNQIAIKNEVLSKHKENIIGIKQDQFYTRHKPEIENNIIKNKRCW